MLSEIYWVLPHPGEGDDREWDGWMASLTQWTWIWANPGKWWRTGKPGVLQFLGSQRVGHDLAIEQQNTQDQARCLQTQCLCCTQQLHGGTIIILPILQIWKWGVGEYSLLIIRMLAFSRIQIQVLLTQGFSTSTLLIHWARIFLVLGIILCTVWCFPTSLGSTRKMPVPVPTPWSGENQKCL